MAKRVYPGPPGRRPLDGHTHVWRVGDRATSKRHGREPVVGCEVIEVGYGAIKVRWDDTGEIMVAHPTDVQVPS